MIAIAIAIAKEIAMAIATAIAITIAIGTKVYRDRKIIGIGMEVGMYKITNTWLAERLVRSASACCIAENADAAVAELANLFCNSCTSSKSKQVYDNISEEANTIFNLFRKHNMLWKAIVLIFCEISPCGGSAILNEAPGWHTIKSPVKNLLQSWTLLSAMIDCHVI